MNVRELIDYAKENGFNTVMFELYKNDKYLCSGKFLDAYYEFIEIPVLGDGFTTLQNLEEELGYEIEFKIIDTIKEYKVKVAIDHILRGKEIPKEYTETQNCEEN